MMNVRTRGTVTTKTELLHPCITNETYDTLTFRYKCTLRYQINNTIDSKIVHISTSKCRYDML